MKFTVPIELPSLTNERLHWRKMAKLKVFQKGTTTLFLRGVSVPTPPVIVTITRVGPRRLDDDNLAAACKYVRDAIATHIGTDDGSDLYTWRCEQRIGPYGVEVEITAR